VLQWAAVMADRRLTLAGLSPEAGEPSTSLGPGPAWLKDAFRIAGNPDGLLNPLNVVTGP